MQVCKDKVVALAFDRRSWKEILIEYKKGDAEFTVVSDFKTFDPASSFKRQATPGIGDVEEEEETKAAQVVQHSVVRQEEEEEKTEETDDDTETPGGEE